MDKSKYQHNDYINLLLCYDIYNYYQSRFHVLEDPVHVVPDGGEDCGDADAALFCAEGDDAGEVHGAVDAAGAGDQGTAAVAVARIAIWKEGRGKVTE